MKSRSSAHRKRRKSRPLSRYHIRRRTTPGAAPGMIVPEPGAPKSKLVLTHYTAETLEERVITEPQDIKKFLGRPGITWCDVDGLGDAKLLASLAEIFHIHSLAMEDVVNTHQRAKVEQYGATLFIVMRLPHLTDQGVIETEQISLFLGQNFLLTFQPRPGDAFPMVRERLRASGSLIRREGADYLAYALIDLIIDTYFPVLEHLAEELETLDESVSYGDPRRVVQQIHELRRELLYLRRTLWPHRDALQAVTRDHHPLLSPSTLVHLRDCWDHVVALVDLTETYRELCADLRDYCASAISNRMNEIMKWLTLIATIFIPLSFIAGIYGMNFDPAASPWNMPELRWRLGYPMALALMALVAGVMMWSFYRRGWIGQDWPIAPRDSGSPSNTAEDPASRGSRSAELPQNNLSQAPGPSGNSAQKGDLG